MTDDTTGALQSPSPAATPRSPLVILIGADKGGVGKTMAARALADYLAGLGVQVRAFDTEPGEVGVLRRFLPSAEMVDISTVGGQMAALDAPPPGRITLIDAHAGLLTPLLKSFSRMRLLDDVRSGALRLLVLHVIGPSVASASEVPVVMAALQGASLMLVHNAASPDSVFPAPLVGQTVIRIPNLSELACAAVDHANEGFSQFISNTKNSRVLRGYVESWLGDTCTEFERAHINEVVLR